MMRCRGVLLLSFAVVACAKGSETSGGGDAGFVGRPDDDVDSGGTVDFDSGPSDFDSGNTDAPSGCTNKIVINELQQEGNAVNDEFIELYNASGCDVSIDNFKLMYKS